MTLLVQACAREAALYAVSRFHYSEKMPIGRSVKFGVWESTKFIGVVIFGDGVSPKLGGSFGVTQHEVTELTRVALSAHQVAVSKVIAVSIRLLRKSNPGLRILVSYADPEQGHHGGIYQAGNWIYHGQRELTQVLYRGQWRNDTSAKRWAGWQKRYRTRKIQGKHKYVYPLDGTLRERLEERRQPYPKRALVSEAVATSDGKAVQSRPARSNHRNKKK